VFLTWRTEGPVHERSRALARVVFAALAAVWPLATWATHAVNPEILRALPGRPLAWLGLTAAAGGLITVFVGLSRGRPLVAFLGSCAWIAGMLGATAACLYPVMLRAVPDAALSITALNAGTAPQGLRIATGWWSVGFPIVILYFYILFRIHRGKVVAAREGEGY